MGSKIPMTRTRRKNANEASPDRAKLDEYVRTRVQRVLGKAENDTQTSLRLPRVIYDALTKAAEEHGLGIGEEIRLRLGSSLGTEPVEQETQALIDLLGTVAQNIEPTYGLWHESPFAFLVFKEALNTLLTYLKPKGEPVPPKPDPDSRAALFFGENASPETAGKALAMAALAAAGRLGGKR